MEHFYIEKGSGKLYCVYHEPEINENNKFGVIFCNPIGQEYIRCHRFCTNLSQTLALKGFHVFRFDYTGTGDSYDSFETVGIKCWMEDLTLAINEFKQGSGIERIILTGIRFGGYLANLYAESNKVDGLILLSPILNGRNYINEIKKEYRKWLEGSFAKHKQTLKGSIESFGFVYSKELLNEIQGINIQSIGSNNVSRVLLLDENSIKLGLPNPNLTFKKLVNNRFWLKRDEEKDKSLIPMQEINVIVDWI